MLSCIDAKFHARRIMHFANFEAMFYTETFSRTPLDLHVFIGNA